MGGLEGKVALVTGAGRGFGRAIAERFAEEGADLALNYRESRQGCEEVAAQARQRGRRAVLAQADVGDGAAVAAMVRQVEADLGRIDILVNNAGIMRLGPFEQSSEDAWHAEIDTNVFGPLHVTRAVVPGMIARRYGRIVNISSQLAITGWERGAVYTGTKGFLLSWTRALARELGQHGITVNAIGPGSIITDMNRDVYPDEAAKARRAKELPLRRLGTPRDVAEVALFFASDASSFLTGQFLSPSGGNVM